MFKVTSCFVCAYPNRTHAKPHSLKYRHCVRLQFAQNDSKQMQHHLMHGCMHDGCMMHA